MRLIRLRVRLAKRRLCVLLVFAVGAGGGIGWAVLRSRTTVAEVRQRLRADLRAGRADRCQAGLQWLARHDRLNTEDLMIAARVAQLEGFLEDAVAILGRIDERDSLVPQARVLTALIELSRDRARPAEAALRAAVRLDPGHRDARQMLIRLYGRQQRLADLDEQCRELAMRGELDFSHLHFWCLTRTSAWKAADEIETLRRSVAADRDDRASRLALIEGLRRLGRVDEAEEIVAGLPDADPDARVARARLAVDRGDAERAARLTADGPREHAGLARLRGQLALLRGNATVAVEHLRIARRLKPGDRETMFALATSLKVTGDTDGARPLLAAVQGHDLLRNLLAKVDDPASSTDSDLLRRIGAACEGLGQRSEARAWYLLSIARNPLDSPAHQALFRLDHCPDGAAPAN